MPATGDLPYAGDRRFFIWPSNTEKLTDESVCPTLGGAGASACQPIFSQHLPLDRADLDRPLEARLCVRGHPRRIFVPKVPGVIQVRDGLRDEPVVQFLGLVDFLPVRIAARVEMPDPLKVVADIAHDIAHHTLPRGTSIKQYYT